MSRAVSLSLIVDDGVGVSVRQPSEAWAGYVAVEVDEDGRSAATLYVSNDKARALVEQLTAALEREAVKS